MRDVRALRIVLMALVATACVRSADSTSPVDADRKTPASVADGAYDSGAMDPDVVSSSTECASTFAITPDDIVIDAGLKPYDILALVPIITGAGGHISAWDGAPIHLGHFSTAAAAGSAALHQEMLDILRQSV